MSDIDRAVRATLDRNGIEQVINRYFFGADTGDVELVVSCFTDAAEVKLMDGTSVMHGRSEIREAFTAARGNDKLALRDIVGKSHVPGNMQIEINGDRATATTLTVAFLKGSIDGVPSLVQRGISYVDELVRTPEGWLIADRTHRTRWHHVSHEAATS